MENTSLENGLLTYGDAGIEMRSVITGKTFQVQYVLKADRNWQTLFVEINAQQERLLFENDGLGNWRQNGEPVPKFQGCLDVDISLTPFTNTLPINRLQLQTGESREIQVLYFDVLEGQIKPLRQRYTRLSAHTYRYENVPNDFEAVITVDEQGLVVDYPGLFRRT